MGIRPQPWFFGSGRRAGKTALIGLSLLGALFAGHFGATVCTQWLYSHDGDRPDQHSRPLSIDSRELDLGRIYDAASLEHTFHVTNEGDDTVLIERFRTSCDCLGIVPSQAVDLGPRQSKAFVMRLAPSTDGQHRREVAFGAVCSVGGKRTFTTDWRLAYVVIPTIAVRDPVIHFGVRSSEEAGIELYADCDLSAGVSRVEAEPSPNWSVDVVRDADNPAALRHRIVVRSRRRLPPAQYSEVIHLWPVGPGGKRLPYKDIRIDGDVVWDVVPSPAEIHLGRRPLGESVREAVCLRSLTGRRFQMMDVSSDDQNMAITRSNDDPNIFLFCLKVSALGDRKATAAFSIRSETGAEFRVDLPVRYCGIAGTPD